MNMVYSVRHENIDLCHEFIKKVLNEVIDQGICKVVHL